MATPHYKFPLCAGVCLHVFPLCLTSNQQQRLPHHGTNTEAVVHSKQLVVLCTQHNTPGQQLVARQHNINIPHERKPTSHCVLDRILFQCTP